ncbi:twin arginine-targeting protein translocase, TatA/E family [Corynebacterium sp. CMW7794]|uniref:Sec-independent protein translocase protein TatA n=1 Tax=Corynebacterium phoceense TaxID=1686286 RepID=A0A540R5W4_9CORY|nr:MULTISPECIES: Sec-independent protein translocase subunit TatA [Corynebacterium]KXB55339.1 twin arginine-targeting protein translocase, TatA/E family [Corynebacterium sp. DNF00584]KXI16565.1 twin arginine-targeting protein translocase, TatA/E family [Corynebacterium sp. CMW7794]MBF9011977.1 Sec-independent protein translocase subunit TatA [Corynebacterium phoceense]OFL80300.1 hypothetical protein HMPREF2748_07505 [Corynebacterium sp. HMSC077B05]OFN44598.1 hypothetical protein HMPREF2559_005
MGRIGAPEIIIIVLIIVLLFGAKKLPDLARSLGRSMRIIKSEVNEMNNDNDRPSSDLEQNQLPQGQQQFQQTAQQNFTQQPQAQQPLPPQQPNYGSTGNYQGGDYGQAPQQQQNPNA